jgi:hypothetical protein
MPVFTVTSARPRQELAVAVVEGEGQVPGLIYPKVLPEFPINRRTAHIIKATLQNSVGLRQIASAKYLRAPGALFERVVAKFDDDSLTVQLRGIEILVPNETQLDYDEFLDVEQFFAARFGREVSGLTKEYLAQAALFNTSTFGSATNSTVAYTQALLSTIDFVGDVILSTRRLKAKGEPPPYKIVMSGVVWERVRQAGKTISFVAGSLQPGFQVSTDKMQNALSEFGIEEICIGDTYYNSAADSAAPSLTQIWSNGFIWVGRPGLAIREGKEGASVPQLGGVGVTAYWEGFSPGGIPSVDKDSQAFEGGNYVESYPVTDRDSMALRLKMSSLPYIGNARAGDLINPQYS